MALPLYFTAPFFFCPAPLCALSFSSPAKLWILIICRHLRYGLAVATSIMFYMVVKKPPTDLARRVRQNKDWS